MRLAAIVSMIVLTLALGRALAADPAPPAPAAGDERQKLLEAGALMVQGKYDEAIEAAKGLLRTAKEDTTRTDAARVIAESLRKKGEWKAAAAAYLKLRDRYDKGSDSSIKNEAIAEILTASPTGVYPPLEAAEAKVKPAAPNAETSAADPAAASPAPAKPAGANLADDDYLARAIACLAAARIEKIKARIASIKKARTPQEAEAAFAALAEDIRQARSLSSSGSAEPEQAAAQAANERLANLGKQVVATLNAKLADFQAAAKNHSLTLMQRKEMEGLQTLCTDLAKNEASFQATAGKLTALTDGTQSRDSSQREAEYTRLAEAFEPPPMDSGRDYGNGRAGGGGGGGGGRGGGGRGGR